MKVRELLGQKLLIENIITLDAVETLEDLINPKTGKYYTEVVNVTGNVNLYRKNLLIFPVKFGTVGGDFYCSFNKLTSLEGAPPKVGAGFVCSSNNLTSLEGAPQEIGGKFNCFRNFSLTSLEGIHKIIKKINGSFTLSTSLIESGGIGLLLIEGITNIGSDLTLHPAFKIINKYIGQGKKGLLLCQEELIEAGLEEYAKL